MAFNREAYSGKQQALKNKYNKNAEQKQKLQKAFLFVNIASNKFKDAVKYSEHIECSSTCDDFSNLILKKASIANVDDASSPNEKINFSMTAEEMPSSLDLLQTIGMSTSNPEDFSKFGADVLAQFQNDAKEVIGYDAFLEIIKATDKGVYQKADLLNYCQNNIVNIGDNSHCELFIKNDNLFGILSSPIIVITDL